MSRSSRITPVAIVSLAMALSAACSSAGIKPVKKTSQELRADYLTHLNEQYMPPPNPRTVGSLWSAANALGDLSSDYRARNINDTIIVQVSVQTTAAQSGNVDSERTFTTNLRYYWHRRRGSTAAPIPCSLRNSSHVLKGQGSTASNTTFSTDLTGQIIAVLTNGNMVIEAERKIAMNNQHEDPDHPWHRQARRYQLGQHDSFFGAWQP